MELKIFSGKAAKNNEAILKILYEKGNLSAWKLANEMAALEPKKPKDVYHKAQKIQSVLVRKDGRLKDLVKKGFVQKKEGQYCLTFDKGFCSALVLFGNKHIPKPVIDEFFNFQMLPPELRNFLSILSRYNPDALQESYREVQEVAISLLQKGLNFERLPNEEFSRLYSAQYEEFIVQRLKKGEKSKANAEWTPELKEAAYAFVAKLNEIVQVKAKELAELTDKYALKKE